MDKKIINLNNTEIAVDDILVFQKKKAKHLI